MKRSIVLIGLSTFAITVLSVNVLLVVLSPPSLSVGVSGPDALVLGDSPAEEQTLFPNVKNILLQAGVPAEDIVAHESELPSMENVVRQFGRQPVIVGLDSCAEFRRTVPAERRMLGAAGMFSTGTNLVTQLLKQNCYIPARRDKYGSRATKEELGMRWQVPWGKHTPAHFKWHHATEKAAAINKGDVLPVITVRNPWRWMQSMCKNPYAARWPHHSQCPNLKTSEDKWNEVVVKYGAASEPYLSLAHLWNDWYQAYLRTRIVPGRNNTKSFPWVAVRMEDLVFHTVPTIRAVCECAGGELSDSFRYITASAKADSPGHDTSTGVLQAWIKYSKPLQKGAGFGREDYEAALDALDSEIMDLFQYHNPPPLLEDA